MREIPGISAELFERAKGLSTRADHVMRATAPSTPPAVSPAKAEMPEPKIRDGVATLRLYDVIDPDGGYWGISALEFVDTLDKLEDEVSAIELHINSRGGSVWDGLTILNSLRQSRVPVTAVVDGIAASAASFIAVACDDVVMMPNSQMMIHDALGICVGQADDMRAYASFLDDSSDNIATIYASKAGGTAETWREVMKANGMQGRWYTPDQAAATGLIDRVGGAPAEATNTALRDEPGPEAAAPLTPAVESPSDSGDNWSETKRRQLRMKGRKAATAA